MSTNKVVAVFLVIGGILLLSYILSVYTPENTLVSEEEKQWVWIEVKVELPRDTSDYFYYGQINKSLIEKINSDEEKEGLFMLSKIRYWNNNDLLERFENTEYSGSKVFKIQSINQLILSKGDPIDILELDELSPETIKWKAANSEIDKALENAKEAGID